MEKYTICTVKSVGSGYEFWDGLDENGENYYRREEFAGYVEDNMTEMIPLPGNVYLAIAYREEDEEDFMDEEEGESIFFRLDSIDNTVIVYNRGEEYHSDDTPDERYVVYIFYNYPDLQYAKEKLEEFFGKKEKRQ